MNKLIHVDTHEFKATLESKVLSLSPPLPSFHLPLSLSLSLLPSLHLLLLSVSLPSSYIMHTYTL